MEPGVDSAPEGEAPVSRGGGDGAAGVPVQPLSFGLYQASCMIPTNTEMIYPQSETWYDV